MNFGEAIEALKLGSRVAREGWNGKKMFIYLNKGSVDVAAHHRENRESENFFVEGIKFDLFEAGDNGTVTRLPNLNMKVATGSTVTGWLASQTDILAEDWSILLD